MARRPLYKTPCPTLTRARLCSAAAAALLAGVSQPTSPSSAALPALLRPSVLAEACTEGVLPEFDEDLEVSPCLLLPRRVVWRGGARPPLLIRQTFDPHRLGSQSTGAAVWAGGLALARYMEGLGPGFWAGKRVVELGAGTGLASITAALLGATVVATDGDAQVLTLASANAQDNLGSGGAAASFSTATLTWGRPLPPALLGADVVVGADLTYRRDAWPALVQTLRALRAPTLLSASERRPNELGDLQAFLTAARLRYTVLDSPLRRGYAAEKVKIFRIDTPGEERCELRTEDVYAPEPTLVVECQPPQR